MPPLESSFAWRSSFTAGCGRSLGPIIEMASISINRTAALSMDACLTACSARTPPSLGTLPKARSPIESGTWRDKTGNGRAGQAFALVESGVVDGATANSLLRTAAGHKQNDQTAKTKPPQEAARGFWIRAWGQREPALQGTGRSNHPARWLGWLEGGLGDPCQSRQNQLASHRTPDPNVDVPRFSHSSVESGSFSFMR